jgi:hypothetical protein
MNPRVILTLALCLLALGGCAKSAKYASIEYEIYSLMNSSNRELLAKGTIMCDPNNVSSVERSAFGQTFWQKSIQLSKGFVVGASVYRETELNGFGLWISGTEGGFSWNWFTRESGFRYKKLQGEGRVEATMAPNKEYEELVAVEFLTDVTLTGRFGGFPFLGDTHQVVIKKGSVLRLAP